MDDIDRAQQREQFDREQAIAAAAAPDQAKPLYIDGLPCCCECGAVIPKARLDALPTAARCIECQGVFDKQQRMRSRR